MRDFLERARDITWSRRVFLSKIDEFHEKMLGLAPRGACVGDTIAMLFGLSVPVILRLSSIGGGGSMGIVGAAYVDGKMEGEVVHQLGGRRVEGLTETFEIVWVGLGDLLRWRLTDGFICLYHYVYIYTQISTLAPGHLSHSQPIDNTKYLTSLFNRAWQR